MKHHLWDDTASEDSALVDLGVTLAAMVLAALLVVVLAIAWGCSPPYPPPAHAQGGRERPRAVSQALLPRVQGGGRVSVPPTPTAAPRPSQTPLSPVGEADIRASLAQPGVRVEPEGDVRLSQYGYMASGTTLDGHGKLTLRGRGLIVDGQRDVTIRGVRLSGSPRDGISILRSTNVLIDGVQVDGFSDGGIDIIRAGGPSVIVVRDTVINGRKQLLVGHPSVLADRLINLTLDNVSFIGWRGTRTPKVHFARVSIKGGRIVDFMSGIECQGGGSVDVVGTVFRPLSYAKYRVNVAEKGGCAYSEAGITVEGAKE